MIRRLKISAAVLLLGSLALPAVAHAEFGIVPGSLTTTALNKNGTIDTQASSHPYSYTVSFKLNTDAEGFGEGGELRDVLVDLPPGMVGDPLATPRCTRQDFEGATPRHCPPDTQIGVIHLILPEAGGAAGPIYNVVPPPGVAAQIGFGFFARTSLQNATVGPEGEYSVRVAANDIPEDITAVEETIWGVPAVSGHDDERGQHAAAGEGGETPSTAPELPFLTLPATCSAPLTTTVSVDSKLNPGHYVSETAESLNAGGQPEALGGCEAVPFAPQLASQPTSKLATNPSGLEFELALPDEGLLNPGGIAETEPRKVEVSLPEGMSANPSFAEGVSTCSKHQYEEEKLETKPGEACPQASKLGSVIARSPLIEEPIEGSLYLATPYENEFDSLIALYMVLRDPERGVLIKQAGEVKPNPQTGQLSTTFKGLPPLPYSSFHLHFREGARAPLATPPACGQYKTVAKLTPFSSNEALERSAYFQIEHGSEGGECPTEATPPFHPELLAGTLNNAAGAFSPFYLRITRHDSEQEITHFSIKLPPGVTGKLAGIPYCPNADIQAAKAREDTPTGGQEEIEHPSCPAASEIGHTLAGAGVGPSLTYVPGKVYLAGPYNGSNLSVVAITAAKAGPFDLGTVVVREALRVNPETAEVFIDATGSDPIPHIIDGIPVHLRDLRVYVDKPEFVINPSSCEPTSTASTVLGSGKSFTSEADDVPVTVTSRFQAADCAALPFKPQLKLSLKGSAKRGGTPKLIASLKMNGVGEAAIAYARVTLPHSEFLDNAHIKTICTRVQFNAGNGNGEDCPAESIYGFAKATTPLLSEPLEGPVFLRSNGGERELPDLVAALRGQEISIDLVGYISSAKGGRITNTFEVVPDAPVSTFTLEMQGGKKGLLENSTNLCQGSHRAEVEFVGHNGKVYEPSPELEAQCKKSARKKKKRGKRHHERAAIAAARLGW